MRYDDTTLMLLRLVPDDAEEDFGEAAAEAPEDEQAATDVSPATPQPGVPADDEWPSVVIDPAPADQPLSLPPPGPGALEQWKEKLKTVSEKLVDQTGHQVARGLQKLGEVTQSAGSSLQEYLKKLREKNRPHRRLSLAKVAVVAFSPNAIAKSVLARHRHRYFRGANGDRGASPPDCPHAWRIAGFSPNQVGPVKLPRS